MIGALLSAAAYCLLSLGLLVVLSALGTPRVYPAVRSNRRRV